MDLRYATVLSTSVGGVGVVARTIGGEPRRTDESADEEVEVDVRSCSWTKTGSDNSTEGAADPEREPSNVGGVSVTFELVDTHDDVMSING